ncbi:MAG: hypothetical protein AAF391_08155 [Bacteroidota bacterium]
MDQQNIDRLFREKLDGLEVTPSNQAWSQVEKQIRPTKSRAIYWVAASITLLFVSWLVWPEQSHLDNGLILSTIDHPVALDAPELAIPVAIDLDKVEKQEVQVVKKSIVTPLNTMKQVQVAKVDVQLPQQEEISFEEIETQETVAIEEVVPTPLEEIIATPVVEEIQEEPLKTVKITYIASANQKLEQTEAQKNDSTGVLKKFIAFAGKIDPGEMLADMKTAKDNLINGGLKNKKDRSAMVP